MHSSDRDRDGRSAGHTRFQRPRTTTAAAAANAYPSGTATPTAESGRRRLRGRHERVLLQCRVQVSDVIMYYLQYLMLIDTNGQ